MIKLTTFILTLSFINLSFSQTVLKKEKKIQEQKEEDIVDYSSIKNVLKTDGLIKHKMAKDKKIQKILEKKKEINTHKYNYPSQEDFWSFLSELWLVKNAQTLHLRLLH